MKTVTVGSVGILWLDLFPRIKSQKAGRVDPYTGSVGEKPIDPAKSFGTKESAGNGLS